LAEAQKLQIEVDPLLGVALQKIVSDMQSIPKTLAVKIKAIDRSIERQRSAREK
jgi:hypothetical protein